MLNRLISWYNISDQSKARINNDILSRERWKTHRLLRATPTGIHDDAYALATTKKSAVWLRVWGMIIS